MGQKGEFVIDPNRMHRAKGRIKTKHRLADLGGTITVNGHDLQTYQDLSRFEIGELVSIQAQWSIVLDQYIIKTVRRTKLKQGGVVSL